MVLTYLPLVRCPSCGVDNSRLTEQCPACRLWLVGPAADEIRSVDSEIHGISQQLRGLRADQQRGQDLDGIPILHPGGAQHAGQHLLGAGPAPGEVPAP